MFPVSALDKTRFCYPKEAENNYPGQESSSLQGRQLEVAPCTQDDTYVYTEYHIYAQPRVLHSRLFTSIHSPYRVATNFKRIQIGCSYVSPLPTLDLAR
jgi:hypothetical protein